MDAQRLQYLKAMDIEVWERRSLPVAASVPLAAPGKASLAPSAPSRPAIAAEIARPRPAIAPADWTQLEQAVSTCTLCSLSSTRTRTVFGVGDRQAEWMVIGEAPGADEDRQGEPFVGRAGQLLTSMLQAIGLRREQVFIANILKCRPPGNRDPKPEEVVCCMPYLKAQIDLVNPRILLCVGRIAAQNLLGTDTPIGKLRGKRHVLPGSSRPVVVTYHPAYLLRSPGEKRKAWTDLVMALDIARRPVVT